MGLAERMLGKGWAILWAPWNSCTLSPKWVHIHMDGPTYHWFNWLQWKIPNMSSERFAEELIRSAMEEERQQSLLCYSLHWNRIHWCLHQAIWVVIGSSGGFFRGSVFGVIFWWGFREEICRRMGIIDSRTIMRAMDLARAIDEDLIGYQGSYWPYYSSSGLGWTREVGKLMSLGHGPKVGRKSHRLSLNTKTMTGSNPRSEGNQDRRAQTKIHMLHRDN